MISVAFFHKNSMHPLKMEVQVVHCFFGNEWLNHHQTFRWYPKWRVHPHRDSSCMDTVRLMDTGVSGISRAKDPNKIHWSICAVINWPWLCCSIIGGYIPSFLYLYSYFGILRIPEPEPNQDSIGMSATKSEHCSKDSQMRIPQHSMHGRFANMRMYHRN